MRTQLRAAAGLLEHVRAEVTRAEEALWEVIDATREMRTSELWTWGYDEDEGWQVVPFGQGGGTPGRVQRRAALEHGLPRRSATGRRLRCG